ncbi:hypothetical protein [Streptomyces yangpuensis]
MGFTGIWAISSHPDSFVAALAPTLLPAMAADRCRPGAQDRWRRWQRAPLPEHTTWYTPVGTPSYSAAADAAVDSFLRLTAPGQAVDDVCDGTTDPAFYAVDDVWAELAQEDVFLSVHSKQYAVASFLHAVGPARAALLPGWCGNFLLTSAQVREQLGAVERALSFGPAERAAADARDWLHYAPGEERVLDGPLRMWRHASRNGLGLCGLAVHLS